MRTVNSIVEKLLSDARGITIPSQTKNKINAAFNSRGLDGNGHFTSMSEAFGRIEDVLQMFSITAEDNLGMLALHGGDYDENNGRKTFHLIFNGEQVGNSVLAMTWYQRYQFPSDHPKDFEIVAYVS